MPRELTPELQAIADAYNAMSPKEQRKADQKLRQLQTKLVLNTPHGLFMLFPTLGTKSLKTVTPKEKRDVAG